MQSTETEFIPFDPTRRRIMSLMSEEAKGSETNALGTCGAVSLIHVAGNRTGCVYSNCLERIKKNWG